jgi:hypothetical protein
VTDPIGVSNSELSTFGDCRRKWYLHYYKQWHRREKSFSGPLALGSRVHKALELYYNDVMDPTIEDADLVGHWHELVRADRELMDLDYRDPTDFENEAELGRIMLEGYLQWNEDEGIDADLEIVSSEERLSVPMLDGRVHLMGKIDQRVRRKIDGVRLLRDFKTSGNPADNAKTSHMDEQFLTYMVLEATQKNETERVEGALITVLKKVKRTAAARPPFYDQIEVRHNVFTLRNFWTRLQGKLMTLMSVRDALDQGADHHLVAYPRPTRDCSWKCDFYAICPMFDDGSAVDQALEAGYEQASPYSYYGSDDPSKTKLDN